MYDRMVHEHGYSIRKLAEKLGKDKGYLENRLRLADAPEEIRELVSLRKDTLSHAYELLKVDDPKKRRRAGRPGRPRRALAGQAAGARSRAGRPGSAPTARRTRTTSRPEPPRRRDGDEAERLDRGDAAAAPIRDDSLVDARHQLNDAVEDLVAVLRSPDVVRSIADIDRANLAKYLTIAKLRLENAIAVVRDRRDRLSGPSASRGNREAGACGAGFVMSGWTTGPRLVRLPFVPLPVVLAVRGRRVVAMVRLGDAPGPTRRGWRSRPACLRGPPR